MSRCIKHNCKIIYSVSCGQFYCPKCTEEAAKEAKTTNKDTSNKEGK
jgi:hypothetical protein